MKITNSFKIQPIAYILENSKSHGKKMFFRDNSKTLLHELLMNSGMASKSSGTEGKTIKSTH